MTFFGFPKVKWLHLTGEIDKSVRCAQSVINWAVVGQLSR